MYVVLAGKLTVIAPLPYTESTMICVGGSGTVTGWTAAGFPVASMTCFWFAQLEWAAASALTAKVTPPLLEVSWWLGLQRNAVNQMRYFTDLGKDCAESPLTQPLEMSSNVCESHNVFLQLGGILVCGLALQVRRMQILSLTTSLRSREFPTSL